MQLVSGLHACNDRSTRRSIQPDLGMKFTTYKSDFTQFNSKAVRYSKAQFVHVDKAARFVYEAFVAVVHTRTSVSGWDESNYAYL
ncbi:hypothetical protein C8Q72DRAFT_951247 [Fomitopsis betulina]|nr:hypothetical protein C8Q72DRAFT_951247 [Fomitopsis betulina]